MATVLDLLVHLVPREGLHLDALQQLQQIVLLGMDKAVQLELLLSSFHLTMCALQLGRDKPFQNRKLRGSH